MKLLFINSAYPQEIEEQLRNDSNKGYWQRAANVFQWSIIDGLNRNNIDFTLACTPSTAAWPNYHKLFTPRGVMAVNGEKRGHYLRYCSAPVINQLTRKLALSRYASNWCKKNRQEDRLIILCYTQQIDKLGPAIKLKSKYPNLVVATIVTDLIENAMSFSRNRRIYKRLQIYLEAFFERKLFGEVDKYILLTHQMTEYIPEAMGRFMVMEGVANWDWIMPRNPSKKDENIRSLFYAGTFQEYAGLRMLVDAFMKTDDPRFRLLLCGGGTLSQYVETAAKVDNRIIYKGFVTHEEVVRLQRESTLLINPRLPNGDITKYSFPSKTMEYMSSLTPMIGYHLEGIPEEYYPYMFTPTELTQESLTECINNTLSLPIDILQQKANEAYNFVAEKKNSYIQVRKIIEFLKS